MLLARSGDTDYNPPEWLMIAQPRVVIVSVSAYNRGSLPDAEVLENLSGHLILRTDLNGTIELVTDGSQMWVYAEQNRPREMDFHRIDIDERSKKAFYFQQKAFCFILF